MKKFLFVLLIAMAFALVSCGEEAETITDQSDKDTELARAGDVQVTKCDGNICTHETASGRECAVEGKCPHLAQAEIARAGAGCPYAAECAESGKCVGKCEGKFGDACTGACEYCKDKHVCTDACPENCAHGKGHVCTDACPENCAHAKGHVCTDACPENCAHAKGHVCTDACSKDCPHAVAATVGCPGAAKATKADACGGCPRKNTCKSGT